MCVLVPRSEIVIFFLHRSEDRDSITRRVHQIIIQSKENLWVKYKAHN